MSSEMKQVMGIWLPAHENHMIGWMQNRMREHPEEMVDGKASYQLHKLRAALRHVTRRRVAVDVGAHVGFWSMHLVRSFEHVHAFEPVSLHRKCFLRNVTPESKYTLHVCALGDHAGTVQIATTNGSSGDTKVVGDHGDTTLKRLDDVIDPSCVDHDKVDFVKVDCEGYELFVLRGGEELLKRNRPCVIVEQKPGYARRYGMGETGAVEYLKGLGAKLRQEIGGDFIMSWDAEAPVYVAPVIKEISEVEAFQARDDAAARERERYGQ